MINLRLVPGQACSDFPWLSGVSQSGTTPDPQGVLKFPHSVSELGGGLLSLLVAASRAATWARSASNSAKRWRIRARQARSAGSFGSVGSSSSRTWLSWAASMRRRCSPVWRRSRPARNHGPGRGPPRSEHERPAAITGATRLPWRLRRRRLPDDFAGIRIRPGEDLLRPGAPGRAGEGRCRVAARPLGG